MAHLSNADANERNVHYFLVWILIQRPKIEFFIVQLQLPFEILAQLLK